MSLKPGDAFKVRGRRSTFVVRSVVQPPNGAQPQVYASDKDGRFRAFDMGECRPAQKGR